MAYKVAVITPYYKETSKILEQCHNSVLAQTYECDHIVVSDGHKNDMFDNKPRTLHVVLPKANGDNGNTPRGIGSILAENAGYNAIAYLDADNWFYPDHIRKMVAAHEKTKKSVICCKRTFHDLDGELLSIGEPEEDSLRHVDTSCFVLFGPAFSVLRAWFMPKELGPICDRIFLQKIRHERLSIQAVNDRTVAFRTQYEYHYRLANRPIPAGAKNMSEFTQSIKYLRTAENIQKIVDSIGFYPIVNL